jgi:hypothetical protein
LRPQGAAKNTDSPQTSIKNFFAILPAEATRQFEPEKEEKSSLILDPDHEDKENVVFKDQATPSAPSRSTSPTYWHKTVASSGKLPEKYDVLMKGFEALEAICILYKTRGQEADLIFHKIDKAVSGITHQ